MAKQKMIKEPVVIPVGDCGEFEVTYRRFAGDEGPAAEFFGFIGPKRKRVKLLRLDDFEKDPHYHYNPDTPKDKKYSIDPVVSQSVYRDIMDIMFKLPEMVKAAGSPKVGISIARNENLVYIIEKVIDTMYRLRVQEKLKAKKAAGAKR